MFKKVFATIAILFILALVGGFAYNIYNNLYNYPTNSPKGNYVLKVEKSDTISTVGTKLEKDKVIVSKEGLTWQEKLHPVSNLVIGDYNLNLPAKPEDILVQIDEQIPAKLEEISKASNKPVETITFREGDNVDKIIAQLDQKGISGKAELEAFARDPKNFNAKIYPFLSTPLNCQYGNMTSCAKYYIEGYLYPDTYDFYKSSTPKEIFAKMLDNFNLKVWQRINKTIVNGDQLYQKIVLASMIERETGRNKGITSDKQQEVQEERKKVSSVFANRVKLGMKLESNPTVEYGNSYILCEQTFHRENCKYLDDPVFNTKYNTYKIPSYPIGPITNPQYNSIDAAINPIQTEYLYFVADNTGKTYFGRNEVEHNKIIDEVNQVNVELG